MQTLSSRKYQTSLVRRYFCLALLIVLGYLCEVCIMPYIRILDVSPNLLFVVIGIVTVAYGKLRAFWTGLVFGLLMEIMLPSVTYLNLILYPISTLFCSFAFADKPIKTIEYEKAMNKRRKELPPWARTVLCTALNTVIYEVVNVTYIYLGGSALTISHFMKAFLDVILTSLLCFILLFPVRRMILGPKMEVRVLKSAPVEFKKA
jgi:cell shape-determining protein MreD